MNIQTYSDLPLEFKAEEIGKCATIQHAAHGVKFKVLSINPSSVDFFPGCL